MKRLKIQGIVDLLSSAVVHVLVHV